MMNYKFSLVEQKKAYRWTKEPVFFRKRYAFNKSDVGHIDSLKVTPKMLMREAVSKMGLLANLDIQFHYDLGVQVEGDTLFLDLVFEQPMATAVVVNAKTEEEAVKKVKDGIRGGMYYFEMLTGYTFEYAFELLEKY